MSRTEQLNMLVAQLMAAQCDISNLRYLRGIIEKKQYRLAMKTLKIERLRLIKLIKYSYTPKDLTAKSRESLNWCIEQMPPAYSFGLDNWLNPPRVPQYQDEVVYSLYNM